MSARRILLACLVVPVLFSLTPSVRSAPGDAFPVSIKVDAGTGRGDLHPIWRFFGADEPNYAYMKDGRKLLAALGQLGTPQVYLRTHNLLTSGDGTPALKWGSTNAYTEDAKGNPVYDWTIIDRIFDTYRERGIRPYVQVGFEGRKLSVLAWHYHGDDLPGPDAAVDLSLSALPLASGEARIQHYRIDETHSNSYGAWKRMGSPIAPTEDQYVQLEAAGKLARMDGDAPYRQGPGPLAVRPAPPGRLALRARMVRAAAELPAGPGLPRRRLG